MRSQFIRRNNSSHAQSFSVKHDILPHFIKLWHHHQEFELVFIKQGEGTRFIGDHMETFTPGELVLLGDSLPHMWQSSSEYFEGNELITEAYIIHFERNFLSNAMDETVELMKLQSLLKKAKRGILFEPHISLKVSSLMAKIHETPLGFLRMIRFLEVLEIMSEAKVTRYLTSPGYINSATERDMKLRKVNDFMMNHFQTNLTLQQVADHVCMNKAAFCRFFKKATSKSFTTYLNETRVGYACRLLQNGNRSIAEVCFESGYTSLSNFNQHFKRITGCTPSVYSKKLL